jgi:hypothetical protein
LGKVGEFGEWVAVRAKSRSLDFARDDTLLTRERQKTQAASLGMTQSLKGSE